MRNRIIDCQIAFLGIFGYSGLVKHLSSGEFAIKVVLNHLVDLLHFLLEFAILLPKPVKLGTPIINI
jgi:hypothetical protein